MAKPPLLNQARAAKAYAGFTGRAPDRVEYAHLDDEPVAGYQLGRMEGVAYEATRDGKTERYFHEFSRQARPKLVVKDDGSQLYVVNGKYKVGDRGIEDMPPLMIMNPSKRPSLRRTAKGRFMARTARPVRRRKASKVTVWTRNPTAPRRRKRRARSIFRSNPVAATPHRRRRRHYKRNPIAATRRRHYRRNPIMGGKGDLRLMSMIGPAAGIAVGAVGVELAMGYMPFLPTSMTTGPVRYLTKGAISLGIGWGVAKFVNRQAGEAFALGGLVIAFHDALKSAIVTYMPAAKFGAYVPRAGMGYYSPGQQVPVGRMNMRGIPAPAGSPGGPAGFGVYANPGFGGRASDGGTDYPV